MSSRRFEELESGEIESNYDGTIASFEEMDLKDELVRGIYAHGYERPSAVQQRAIMPIIKANDVILEARSTTGKTNAICISALQLIDTSNKACQVLVLTSSLDFQTAQRIQEFASDVGQFMQMDCPASVGRSDIDDDIRALHNGQQFVVGKPNRILKLIQLDLLRIDSVQLVVLDKADKMFMNETIKRILNKRPQSARAAFSLTAMSVDVLEYANTFMRDPLHIKVKMPGRPLTPVHDIKQFRIPAENEDCKFEVLANLVEAFGATQVIIFCNTRRKIEQLAEAFSARGVTVSAMHRDLDAWQRADMVKEFQSGSIRTLLATNMIATGMLTYINAPLMSSVINYDLPDKHEDSIHRTSYTGRTKREDITVNLVTPADANKVHDIEHYTNTAMEETTIPFLVRHHIPAASKVLEVGQEPNA